MQRVRHAMVVVLAAILCGAVLLGQGPTARDARNDGQMRFATVDVFVDSGQSPLAAWQVEITGTLKDGRVQLVGIEGGEHAAYRDPAYYDPAALADAGVAGDGGGGGGGGRVVLAAFNTTGAEALPTGRTRIARLHVALSGNEARPEYQVAVRIAADPEGNPINHAAASAVQGDDE